MGHSHPDRAIPSTPYRRCAAGPVRFAAIDDGDPTTESGNQHGHLVEPIEHGAHPRAPIFT
jgi:hypothetical protein